MSAFEESIVTLVFPDDYLYQLNSVAKVTNKNVIYLRRKFFSRVGWELEAIPLSDFVEIEYKKELVLSRIIYGGLLSVLLLFILLMLINFGAQMSSGAAIPVWGLLVAGLYGVRLLFGGRRHYFKFIKSDGSKLVWRSLAGEDQVMKRAVDILCEFASSKGLLK